MSFQLRHHAADRFPQTEAEAFERSEWFERWKRAVAAEEALPDDLDYDDLPPDPAADPARYATADDLNELRGHVFVLQMEVFQAENAIRELLGRRTAADLAQLTELVEELQIELFKCEATIRELIGRRF